MSDSNILASIPRSATEEVQIAINEYKGKKYLDLRVYYTTDDGINWNPTKKGVTFSPDRLPEVKAAIEAAIAEFGIKEEEEAEE
ncbi:MAG: transcriptional coactivator p15/PC4 family protein [Candidatus Gastranaerophilales bacterium]|nr:transcriptional coactivator p15/PC4 family protein [Candidatus Gastranaerophilales bacterium]